MAGKSKTYELAIKIGGKADSSLKTACMTADKNLSELGTSAKKAAKVAATAVAAIGTGIAAAATAMYKVGESFDGAYDAIRIGTGATGEALGNLEDSFKAVYTSVPASMDDTAAAIADYNKRLGVTGGTLEGLSKAALQVSDMLGDDLGGVVENSSKAFQQWNIAQENMAGSMDYIFKVSQSTGAGFTDLMTDMQTYGAQLQEMGYGFEEGATLIGQLGKEGVNVTEVLGAMKKSVTTMAKSGVSATKGMEQYYTAIKNAGTATEATKIASEVFGARAASTMAAAIRSGSMAVDDLTSSLKNNGETIAGAATDTYDFSEKWTMFKNKMAVAIEPAATAVFSKLGEVFDQLGPKMEAMAPQITVAVMKIADGIGNVVDKAIDAAKWIKEHETLVLMLAGAIGTAVIAYKAIKGVMTVYNTLTALSKVLSIASTAAAAGQTAATVAQTAATAGAIAPTTALAAAMTAVTWPILLIIVAIAALVAIIILVVRNWEWVKTTAINVWNAIKGAWNAAATWFNNTVITPLVNFFSPIVETISGIFRGCWIIIQAIWKAVSTWFNDTVIAPLVSFFSPIVETIGGFFSMLWDNIVAVWTAVGSWFSENVAAPINAAFQTVSDFVKGIFNGLLGFVEGMINGVIGIINKFIGGFSNIVGKAAAFIGVEWDGIAAIPQVSIPRLATGGIVTAPTMLEAGEGGEPEAILPLSKLAALLDEWGNKPKGGKGGNANDGDGETITFSPVFNFYGDAKKADVEEATRYSFEEFKRLYRRLKAEERRKSFSPA